MPELVLYGIRLLALATLCSSQREHSNVGARPTRVDQSVCLLRQEI